MRIHPQRAPPDREPAVGRELFLIFLNFFLFSLSQRRPGTAWLFRATEDMDDRKGPPGRDDPGRPDLLGPLVATPRDRPYWLRPWAAPDRVSSGRSSINQLVIPNNGEIPMKKSRSFTVNALDKLEDRVVLSHGATSAVLHGHQAKLVAADFASFQSAYNNTVIPLAKDMQAAQSSGNNLRAYLDSESISTQVTSLVNGLGDQLAKQLHKNMSRRIRAVITGAPTPTTVGLVTSSPSAGSLQATLSAIPTDLMTNTAAVDSVISVFQKGVINGNQAPHSRGDFVNFEYSLNQTITPMIDSGQSQQQVDNSVATVVNTLGTQLSKDLGSSAQADIQSNVTGATGSGGVTLATSATPVAGSLLATLDSMSKDDLSDWDFINDLALAYSSSSANF
jgi:hypothetical protein